MKESAMIDFTKADSQAATLEVAMANVRGLVMAGGFGKRLGELTRNTPKPLLPVGGTPILERIIRNMADHDVRNFTVSTHFLSEKVRRFCGTGSQWDVAIDYVHEENPLGTAGCLGLIRAAEGDIQQHMLMSNGDIIAEVDFRHLMSHHTAGDYALTICTVEEEIKCEFGQVILTEDRVTGIHEKPRFSFPVAGGVYLLSPQAANLVEPEERCDMPDLIKRVIDAGHRVGAYSIDGTWIDVGRVHDLNRADHLMRERDELRRKQANGQYLNGTSNHSKARATA